MSGSASTGNNSYWNQVLASKSQSLASKLNDGLTRLELQQKLQNTKQRVAAGVQELELQQKLSDSKQRVSQSVKEMDLNSRLATSKEKIKSMNLEQRFGDAKRGFGGAASMLGTNLQKLNFGMLIDKMEQDQGVADNLERKNRDYVNEQQAREMMREAEAACTAAIEEHLFTFVVDYPVATYEEWIADLHPENLHEGKLLEGMGKELDHRFYVEESDHRRLWNRTRGDGVRLEVLPRGKMWLQKQQASVDLLDQPASVPLGEVDSGDDGAIVFSNEDWANDDGTTDDFFDIPVSAPESALAPAILAPAMATTATGMRANVESNSYTADLLDMGSTSTEALVPSSQFIGESKSDGADDLL